MEKIVIRKYNGFEETWFYDRYWLNVKHSNVIKIIIDNNKKYNQNNLLVYGKD